MRHQKKRHRIGRGNAHRKSTLAALSNALIRHKRITTTQAKAKALRVYVEPLINRAKDDTTHNRRQVFRYLQDKYSVTELFGEIAETIGDRPGGYTRIVKLGQRHGDAAPMAMIELVDYNDVRPEGAGGRRKKTRRGRRRTTAAKPAAAAAAAETVDEAVLEAEEATQENDESVDEVETAEEAAQENDESVDEVETAEEADDSSEADAADASEKPEVVAEAEVESAVTAEAEMDASDDTDEADEDDKAADESKK